MGIQIHSLKKRGFLRQIAEGAKRGSMPLREALVAAQGNIFTPTFQKGRIVISNSGSGQSHSFEIGVSGKEFTQDNVFGMLEEFIELLDETVSDSITDGGTQAETDALLSAMFDDSSMIGITEQHGDFSMLNAV